MQISTWDQAESIINMGILKPVAHMLGSINTKVIEYGLCVLEHILMKGEILKEEHGLEYNYCFIHLEEEGILKHLENLQMINDDRLYKKVAAIIDRYLPYE